MGASVFHVYIDREFGQSKNGRVLHLPNVALTSEGGRAAAAGKFLIRETARVHPSAYYTFIEI